MLSVLCLYSQNLRHLKFLSAVELLLLLTSTEKKYNNDSELARRDTFP